MRGGMKKLLHIVASPREDESRTLKVSEAFLRAFQEKHPDWIVDELNLPQEKLPDLGLKTVGGKYVLLSGKDLFGRLKEEWLEIVQHMERFLSADMYVISTPMWNFHIPYMLKHYIDIIVQPRYLFRYTEKGVEGLVTGRKMVVITSRGGTYDTEATRGMDYQEPYLRAIFGFVGIKEIDFVVAQPMDTSAEIREQKLAEAVDAAKKLAARY
jgi:FMN-dependent NADH-azoreductase